MNKSISKHKPGDSSVQRSAEATIRAKLEKKLGCNLGDDRPEVLSKLRLDGFHKARKPVCVEIWAHQGPAKSAQKDKMLKDMCKLLLAELKLGRLCRKVIAVADQESASHLTTGKTWQREFTEVFDLEIIVVELDEKTRQQIREAQKKQYR
jgi:hypothetical protein